jgi:hypothetical protein
MKLLLRMAITSTDNIVIRNLFDVPSIRNSWTRIISANGGDYSGTFEISAHDGVDVKDFFNRYIGYRVDEYAYRAGRTWSGFIYRMTLEINGVQYTRSLEPDLFHNRVRVYYSNLAVQDTEQGNLVYRTVPFRFSDDAQDFSAWQTLGGDAVYRIQVANDDGTTSWAYLGAASTVTNPNDTIAVYQDIGLTTGGWNDADPIGPPALTPESYQVIAVQFEGERYETTWAEDTDSQDAFGTVEYIVSLGGAQAGAAEALRDRHLEEYGYPQTRMAGGVEITEGQRQNTPARLLVDVAGMVATLFWRYRFTSRTGDLSTLLIETVNQSEFITASTDSVTANTLTTTVDCYPMPQRLGDVVQMLVDQGDAAANPYQWRVLENVLYYEARPTTPTYRLANGQLYDANNMAVIPSLLQPGFLLQTTEAPPGILPYGGANYARPTVAYVEEVEFSAPNKLRLTLQDPVAIGTLDTQISAGLADQYPARRD